MKSSRFLIHVINWNSGRAPLSARDSEIIFDSKISLDNDGALDDSTSNVRKLLLEFNGSSKQITPRPINYNLGSLNDMSEFYERKNVLTYTTITVNDFI